MDSHYDILGVSVLATQAEISRAYRTLSLKHHPDKTQGQTQATRDYHTEKFKKINNSNEILSDPEKRITYD
ncbi:heat shock protein DnaJ, partial [Polyplosphaeria fusca]